MTSFAMPDANSRPDTYSSRTPTGGVRRWFIRSTPAPLLMQMETASAICKASFPASGLADLGIDAVWLSPFYPSQLADGGYDVDDYRDVDPRIGTLDEFDEMVAKLHALRTSR